MFHILAYFPFVLFVKHLLFRFLSDTNDKVAFKVPSEINLLTLYGFLLALTSIWLPYGFHTEKCNLTAAFSFVSLGIVFKGIGMGKNLLLNYLQDKLSHYEQYLTFYYCL